MYTKWIYKNIENISEDLKNSGEDELIIKLLAQRGIDTKKRLDDFLHPLKMPIISPYKFKDMQKAVERISTAIDNGELILIWGDFDADGVTSTSVLFKTLKFLGANVDYYIPSRETESHGLNSAALVKLIAKKKMKLLITVDCGISNFDEVKLLNGFKVDTIISDHHDFTGELPEAYAIINPKAQNNLDENLSVDEISYLSYLAGVGVAFKISCALLDKYEKNEFIDEILPLVALGTVADVVPLFGENRCYVQCGLQLISQSKNLGIAKLLEVAGYDINSITADTIAWGIAPRINAAGRLGTVDNALKILLSDNAAEISVAAEELNNLNKVRQELCDRIFNEAVEQIEKERPLPAVVLFNKDWNIGIIGIVASKIVEKYNKPAFLMCQAEGEPDIIRCSARSVEGINLYETIKANEGLFKAFGGHKAAAGLSFDVTVHSFEEVKKALCREVLAKSEGLDMTPVKNIDLELGGSDINFELIDKINMLQPFGEGNQFPVFAMTDCVLKNFRQMGNNNNHSKMIIEKDGVDFEAVYWNFSTAPVSVGEKLDVAFCLKVNEFNSKKTIQLDVADLHWEGCENEGLKPADEIKIYDHRKKGDIFAQVDTYLGDTAQNVIVLAQEKDTLEKIGRYKNLSQRIKNKMNIDKADQIMFFDYPTDENEFRSILDEASAKKIHFMSKVYEEKTPESVLKTLSGMLKYVCTNKGGQVDVCYLSSLLGLGEECLNEAIELFADCEVIKIKSFNDNVLVLDFLEPKGLSEIKAGAHYKDFCEQLSSVNEYNKYLLECDVSELEQTILSNQTV